MDKVREIDDDYAPKKWQLFDNVSHIKIDLISIISLIIKANIKAWTKLCMFTSGVVLSEMGNNACSASCITETYTHLHTLFLKW